MTAIFTRRGIEFWSGRPAPPDLYSVTIDVVAGLRVRRVVTYAEHMEDKRARQRVRLERIYHVESWQAWRLSAWWSPGCFGGFFRGYWAYFDRIGEHEWLRYGDVALPTIFPLVLPLAGERNSRGLWDDWLAAFVETYACGRKNGHPRAATIVWRRGHEVARKPPPRRRDGRDERETEECEGDNSR